MQGRRLPAPIYIGSFQKRLPILFDLSLPSQRHTWEKIARGLQFREAIFQDDLGE
nr:MAG TPA: Phosphotyrosyl phosphate activator (PTPA) protein [Caudoviricetes sp.]